MCSARRLRARSRQGNQHGNCINLTYTKKGTRVHQQSERERGQERGVWFATIEMMRTIPRVAAGACRPTLRPRIAVIHPCLPAGSGGNGSRNPSVHPSIHPSESRHPSTLSLALHSRSRPFGTFPRPLSSVIRRAPSRSISRSLPLLASSRRIFHNRFVAPSPRHSVTLPPHHRLIRLAPTLEPIQSTRTRHSASSLALPFSAATPSLSSSARPWHTPRAHHRITIGTPPPLWPSPPSSQHDSSERRSTRRS